MAISKLLTFIINRDIYYYKGKDNIDYSKGETYDFDEIVSDSFSTAIMQNKMHIAFYLFRQYQAAVLGNNEL